MQDKLDRDTVVGALAPHELCDHYGIALRWHGRWGRARRCPRTDHGTDAFAVSRDGRWHCHACDEGGDLLHLIAAAEQLDIRVDFPKVLEVAAAIAGISTDGFGEPDKPPPPKRAPPPPLEPLEQRIARAQKRAAWLWQRLQSIALDMSRPMIGSAPRQYLKHRGINFARLPADEVRYTPAAISMSEAKERGGDLLTLFRMWTYSDDVEVAGIAIPVRHVETGALVDVRCRRIDPGSGPKVIGMIGGVPHSEGELVGCYGHPHALAKRVVCVVEGLPDYLTGVALWPDFDVLGAVDAASYPLVAAHAAAYCAQSGAQLVLVAQDDGPGRAADRAVDKAAARALRWQIMPEWLECAPHKDLNAWHCADPGAPLRALSSTISKEQ